MNAAGTIEETIMGTFPLTLTEVVEATGGRVLFGRPNGITGISIDSRAIKDGELFVALRGERFDGHDFLDEALKKACGALVSVPPVAPQADKTYVYVENTLKALQDIAHYMREKFRTTVIAVTGTNGKTTTKEMTASIISPINNVLKTTGNLNNHIGLPLNLLRLSDEHDVAVLEMGASAPGDIRELCSIAAPDFGVLTNIGMAHLEGFKDINTILKTKLEMLECISRVAVNADDAFLMEGVEGFEGKVIRYGTSSDFDVYATDIVLDETGASFVLNAAGQSARVNLGVTGMFNVYNALAASSAALMFGLGVEDMKAGLEAFKGVAMRLEIKSLCGSVVISDMYNANPSSMEEAIKELVRMGQGRTIAVLGDMLELGSYSETAHRAIGRLLAGLGVDVFIAVGPGMAHAAEEFKSGGARAIAVEDSLQGRKELFGICKKGDTILVKGSRGMKMERVVEGQGDDAV